MPHRFQNQVETLRRKLDTSPDLLEAWDYFHEELASSEDFLLAGAVGEHPTLWSIVAAAGAKVLGRDEKPTNRALFHLPELHLWHGGCQLGGSVMAVLYFDDIDKGLAGLLRDPEGMDVDLLRFSVVPLDPGTMMSPVVGRA